MKKKGNQNPNPRASLNYFFAEFAKANVIQYGKKG